MGKGVVKEGKYKCDYCKAVFETFEEGEAHHQKSRHQKKEMKIFAIENENTGKRNYDDSEDVDEDVDFDPIKEEEKQGKNKKFKLTSTRKKRGRPCKYILNSEENGGEKGLLPPPPPPLLQPEPEKRPVITSVAGRHPIVPQLPKTFILPPNTKGELFYKCILCESWFDTFDELKSHQMEKHDREDIQPYISDKKDGPELPLDSLPVYFCPKCDFQTYTVEEIKVHRLDHDEKDSAIIWYVKLQPGTNNMPTLVEEATYQCSQCDIMPDVLPIMNSHWDSHHSPLPLKVSRIYFKMPPKDHACNKCDMKFSFPNHLRVHIKYSH